MTQEATTGNEGQAPDPADTAGQTPLDQLPDDVQSYVRELREEAKTRRKELESYKDLGDIDTISRAVRLWNSTSTEEGLQQIFNEAATELGYDISSLTKAEAAEVAAKVEEKAAESFDPSQIDNLVNERVEEATAKLRQEQEQARFVEAVNTKLDALNLTDPQDRHDVLAYANGFMTEDVNSSNIDKVIDQGYEKWTTRLQQLGDIYVEKYLKEKAEQSESTPQVLKGSNPVVSETPADVKSVREAHERMRARLEGTEEIGV